MQQPLKTWVNLNFFFLKNGLLLDCTDPEADSILQEVASPVSQTEEKSFVLAPTPAQLGKAPLQRRQSQGNCVPLTPTFENDSKQELPEIKVTTENDYDVIEGEENNSEANLAEIDDEKSEIREQSFDEKDSGNSPEKFFFKKNIEDGMDK